VVVLGVSGVAARLKATVVGTGVDPVVDVEEREVVDEVDPFPAPDFADPELEHAASALRATTTTTTDTAALRTIPHPRRRPLP
jgi:hypothetical protein